jgi:hypothetical protein
VRPLKYDEAFVDAGEVAPLRVGAGEVALQRAQLRGGIIDDERDRIG